MPQPLTHYLVAKKAVRNTLKDLWRNYANFVGFGSFGPDLFYMKDIAYFWTDEYNYVKISDIMHWEASFQFLCSMLNYTKTKFINDKTKLEKLKAFIYGYYSHVITDVIFHPYVYRVSQDHWKTHEPKENYIEHKRVEAIIDCFVVLNVEQMNPYQFKYYEKIHCYQDDNNKTLDNDVFLLLNTCIKEVYQSFIDGTYSGYLQNKNFQEYFDNFKITDNEHPIHEAYDDFVGDITELYTIKLLSLVPNETLQALVPLKKLNQEQIKKLNINGQPWFSNNAKQPALSVQQLYELAVKSTIKVINDIELFFSTPEGNSENFFSLLGNRSMFLTTDYDLDSGLPCKNNRDTNLLSDNEEIRFVAFISEIDKTYESV